MPELQPATIHQEAPDSTTRMTHRRGQLPTSASTTRRARVEAWAWTHNPSHSRTGMSPAGFPYGMAHAVRPPPCPLLGWPGWKTLGVGAPPRSSFALRCHLGSCALTLGCALPALQPGSSHARRIAIPAASRDARAGHAWRVILGMIAVSVSDSRLTFLCGGRIRFEAVAKIRFDEASVV